MLRRRRTEHDPWLRRYPDERLARLSFDRLCGFPALVSAAELRDRLLQDEGLRRLVLRWLFLRDAGITRQRICELLGELTHAQAATFFEMLVSDPTEAIRLFSRPPYPHRGPLGHALGSGRLPTRLLPLHEPDEGRGRLYLPSFSVYVPYLAPHAYVKERRGDAPADAYSMTPAKVPSAVPLRDYLPGLVVALISGEEFDHAPRPEVLEDEDLGYSEIAAELAKPTVRFTDLRLARDVKPFQIATKLRAYLRELGDGRPDVWRVRSWKRELLGNEATLVSLERDFGDPEAGVIAISFVAASILMLRDLSDIFGSAVDLEGAELPRRIADLASVLRETLKSFEGFLGQSSQQMRDWAGLEKSPEEDGRRIHYGQKLVALRAYRMGVPRLEIACWSGIKVHYESGRQSPHWRRQLWEGRFAGGIEAEQSFYPEFAELFDAYERDHELQLLALKAYHLHLSAVLEERPRFYVRLLSVPHTDLPSGANGKRRIVTILRQSGITLKTARKIVNRAPTTVEGGAHEEEKAEGLKAALEQAGAEVELDRLVPPPAPDVGELLRRGATESELRTEVRRLKTGLERLVHDAFAMPIMDEAVYVIVSNLERDHLEFAELDQERNAARANLKHDAVEEHASYWRRLAGELGLDPGSELERRSARAYVQLGSCMVRGLPVYPEPPESLRRSTQGGSQSP